MTRRLSAALFACLLWAGALGTGVPVHADSRAPDTAPARPPGSGLDPHRLVDLHNASRRQARLPPLAVDDRLTAAARAKLFDMLKRDYFAHRSPDGRQPWAFMRAVGYRYQAAAENLAKGYDSETEVTEAWMRSGGHRANILNPRFTHMGVADAQGIVVVMFARPLGRP